MVAYHGDIRGRSGFTVLELLVVVSIIGILTAIVLPAVVSAREGARKISCSNNLRQLGLAFQQHHDAMRALPSAWMPAGQTTTVYGWALPLLPFMEQSELRDSLTSTLPVAAPANYVARTTSLEIMLCPSDISEPSFPLYVDDEDEEEDERSMRNSAFGENEQPLITHLPTANYMGVFGTIEPDDDYPAPIGDGAVIAERRVRFADLCRGLSKTLIVGERTMAMIPSTWLGVDIMGEDATCRLVGSAITSPNCTECDECEFSSRHTGGVNFLWADGHVGILSDEMAPDAYRRLARRR